MVGVWRRQVETLDERLVEYFSPALPHLLGHADAREMQEVVTLLNQLTLRFKVKIVGPISQMFGPLVTAIFTHVASLDSAIASSSSATVAVAGPQSDDVRERKGLLRTYFSFVHSLVHSDLTSVLSAPQHSVHMGPSLQALFLGCLEGPDLQVQRQCFLILQRLVELWGGSEAGSLTGFNSYILQAHPPTHLPAPRLAMPAVMARGQYGVRTGALAVTVSFSAGSAAFQYSHDSSQA